MPAAANRSGFGVYGVREVAANIKLALGKQLEAAGIENVKKAEELLDRSRPLVPVDTGDLLESGRVEKRPGRNPVTGRFTAGALEARVIYGNSKVDYAVPVHERLDVHHPTGQAKFLEEPAKALAAGDYARDVARSMKRAAG